MVNTQSRALVGEDRCSTCEKKYEKERERQFECRRRLTVCILHLIPGEPCASIPARHVAVGFNFAQALQTRLLELNELRDGGCTHRTHTTSAASVTLGMHTRTAPLRSLPARTEHSCCSCNYFSSFIKAVRGQNKWCVLLPQEKVDKDGLQYDFYRFPYQDFI